REVLHQIGHAAERTVRQPGRDRPAAEVVELHGDGVDQRVARLHARDRRFHQLFRRDVPSRDQLGQPQPVVPLILAESRHRTLLCRGHSTVESVLTRMGWHLPFDRAGRCLTRGQRALAGRDFLDAERLLREALGGRPHSAHVHLYLAHALAEQERLADAEAAFERAAALAPHNFVVPLHLAIVRPGRALPAPLRARWHRRRGERARRLLEAGRFEDAADYLAAQPGALDGADAHALLERARRGAVTAVATALERAAPPERRALLLRRYEYE